VTVIVQSHGAVLLLITQPDHAALARRIMDHWRASELPPSPRRESLLYAIEAHDDGWGELDGAPIVDAAGRIADFITAPARLRQAVWPRGVAKLAADPWAAALVAQHALVIYARYRADAEWRFFFDEMTRLRTNWLERSARSLETLEGDYRFLRLADLLSLTFCNQWTSDQDGDGFSMRWDGSRVAVTPDPFAGVTVPATIRARELPNRVYRDEADAAGAWRGAPEISVSGDFVGGSRR
jgi:hypothetical protein